MNTPPPSSKKRIGLVPQSSKELKFPDEINRSITTIEIILEQLVLSKNLDEKEKQAECASITKKIFEIDGKLEKIRTILSNKVISMEHFLVKKIIKQILLGTDEGRKFSFCLSFLLLFAWMLFYQYKMEDYLITQSSNPSQNSIQLHRKSLLAVEPRHSCTIPPKFNFPLLISTYQNIFGYHCL